MNEDDGFDDPTAAPQRVPWMRELRKPSRRGFVLGAGAAGLVAAGGGIAAGWLTAGTTGAAAENAPHVSSHVVAAVVAETQVLLLITAAVDHASGTKKQALRAILADHHAHLAALRAAAGADAFPQPAPTSAPVSGDAIRPPKKPTTTITTGIARTVEQRASRAAAARALLLTGRDAALLASISASEATHADLLSEVVS